MQYYIDTQSILNSLPTLAQAYGSGTYGEDVYAGETTAQPVTPGIPGIPNTGIFTEQPLLFIPVILAGAVLIAAAIYLIKRTVRNIRK